MDWNKYFQESDIESGEEGEVNEDSKKDRARKQREEVAQKERKKEVAAELHSHLQERDREMERHKFQEAEEHFKALLADLVFTLYS